MVDLGSFQRCGLSAKKITCQKQTAGSVQFVAFQVQVKKKNGFHIQIKGVACTFNLADCGNAPGAPVQLLRIRIHTIHTCSTTKLQKLQTVPVKRELFPKTTEQTVWPSTVHEEQGTKELSSCF